MNVYASNQMPEQPEEPTILQGVSDLERISADVAKLMERTTVIADRIYGPQPSPPNCGQKENCTNGGVANYLITLTQKIDRDLGELQYQLAKIERQFGA